jgi:hypothetical protein
MNPSAEFCKIDAHPDADFAGMYGYKKPTDPSCVKSCTEFAITLLVYQFFDSQNFKQKQHFLQWGQKS